MLRPIEQKRLNASRSFAHIGATEHTNHTAGWLMEFNSTGFNLLENARHVDIGTWTPDRAVRELLEREPPLIERIGWHRRGYYHSI